MTPTHLSCFSPFIPVMRPPARALQVSDTAKGWLLNNAPLFSCKDPTDGTIACLNCSTQKELYPMFESDIAQRLGISVNDLRHSGPGTICHPKTFGKVFHKLFSGAERTFTAFQIKTRNDVRVGGPEGCETCNKFDQGMMQRIDSAKQTVARQGKERHLKENRKERDVYIANIDRAVDSWSEMYREAQQLLQQPSSPTDGPVRVSSGRRRFLSLAADAISSWFTEFPIPAPGANWPPGGRVDTKATMIMTHGARGKDSFCLRALTPGWVAAGSNLQLSNFINGPLAFVVDEMCVKHKQPLPTTLYWQCDRGSDQVGKVWMAFWEHLVREVGLFDEIVQSSLVRWHSHFDCDRMGGDTVNMLLKMLMTGALTYEQFLFIFTNLDLNVAEVIDDNWDFVEWLQPIIRANLGGVKAPRQFRYLPDGVYARDHQDFPGEHAGWVALGTVFTEGGTPDRGGPPRAATFHRTNESEARKKHAEYTKAVDLVLRKLNEISDEALHRFGYLNGQLGRTRADAIKSWQGLKDRGPAPPPAPGSGDAETYVPGPPRGARTGLGWPPRCMDIAIAMKGRPVAPSVTTTTTSAAGEQSQAHVMLGVSLHGDAPVTMPHSDPAVEAERAQARKYDAALAATAVTGDVEKGKCNACFFRTEPPYCWIGKCLSRPAAFKGRLRGVPVPGGSTTASFQWFYVISEPGTPEYYAASGNPLVSWAQGYDKHSGEVAPYFTEKFRTANHDERGVLQESEAVTAGNVSVGVRMTQNHRIHKNDQLKLTVLLHWFLTTQLNE